MTGARLFTVTLVLWESEADPSLTVTVILLMSDVLAVGLSSRYWCGAEKLNTPAAKLRVVELAEPSPQVMVTVCAWSMSGSENEPLRVMESFSLIVAELTFKLVTAGLSLTGVTFTVTVA